MGKVKATIVLEEEVWKRLRHKAIEKEKSASGIVEELIRQYLAKQNGQQKSNTPQASRSPRASHKLTSEPRSKPRGRR
jgi:macrodomain Ter protein organizer (MatP/YcbG family)